MPQTDQPDTSPGSRPSSPEVILRYDGSANEVPDPAALAQFVYRHGQLYDSYLASEPGYERFWSRHRRGVISFARLGRQVLVRGGLVAPREHREELLAEFLAAHKSQRRHVHFLGIGDADLPLFRSHGMQVTKWGEEPIVDLQACTWSGKSFEWVRRQTNYCTRNGVVSYEVNCRELETDQWGRLHGELLAVAGESLRCKAQAGEMKFFEGQIHSHHIGHRRLFVARSQNGTGRIEGFLLCNPIQGGARWATEMYRHRSDCVRGTIPFLFHQAMQQFQREGISAVNLCLLPGVRCHAIPGDSLLFRQYLRLSMKYLGFVFDMAGINHFKSRFRPHYENRYLCSHPHTSLSAIIAYLRVMGVCRVSFPKLIRAFWTHYRKRAERRNLASGDSTARGHSLTGD